jgi:hypothetical protein
VQARDREKSRADKLDQEKVSWRTKMDQVIEYQQNRLRVQKTLRLCGTHLPMYSAAFAHQLCS